MDASPSHAEEKETAPNSNSNNKVIDFSDDDYYDYDEDDEDEDEDEEEGAGSDDDDDDEDDDDDNDNNQHAAKKSNPTPISTLATDAAKESPASNAVSSSDEPKLNECQASSPGADNDSSSSSLDKHDKNNNHLFNEYIEKKIDPLLIDKQQLLTATEINNPRVISDVINDAIKSALHSGAPISTTVLATPVLVSPAVTDSSAMDEADSKSLTNVAVNAVSYLYTKQSLVMLKKYNSKI